MPQIALVTGATGGLGRAFAAGLADRGFNLILTARREAELKQLAKDLCERYGSRVIVMPADLGNPTDRVRLLEELAGYRVDLLLNNAGFGDLAEVVDADPTRLSQMIEVNCQALVELTAAVLPEMNERGRGTIINVASTAAFQPIPSLAVYAATKSFVTSFTQALAAECRPHGIRVLAICPGPTETGFFEAAGDSDAMSMRRTPEQVVATTFKALDRSTKSVVIDGLVNRSIAWTASLMPKQIVLPLARKFLQT